MDIICPDVYSNRRNSKEEKEDYEKKNAIAALFYEQIGNSEHERKEKNDAVDTHLKAPLVFFA